MNNHDSHISVPVIDMSDDIVLVGLPGHSTPILQPLDVNIIAPLKDEFTKVVAGLGQLAKCVTIGKARFPIVLKHSMDRVTPATIVDGFVKTGLCPYDPNAIDQSQIVDPSFADASKSSDTEAQTIQNVSMSCCACGYCLQNPIVKRGLVSEKLANILVPPPEKPLAEKKRLNKRLVPGARLISCQEMLDEIKEKEAEELRKKEAVIRRKEESERKRKEREEEQEMRKIKRQEKEEREARKQREEVAEMVRQEKRQEERERKQKEKDEWSKRKQGKKSYSSEEVLVAAQYVCGVCGGRGHPSDEELGARWYGCDEQSCGNWFHEDCLPMGSLEYLWKSMEMRDEWFCYLCKPWLYEE